MSPLYLYQCAECEKEVEVLRAISDPPPVCCGMAMTKRPTAPSKIEIKGTYSAGYKKGYAENYRRRLEEKRKS